MLPLYHGILAEAINILHLPLYSNGNLFFSLRSCNDRISEAIAWNFSVKKMFLKILKSSEVFPLAQVFPLNFAKY